MIILYYDALVLIIKFLYRIPKPMGSEKSTWVQHDTLEDYHGTLTEQLRSLLRAFGFPLTVPVHTYTFKEGEELVKYRVLVKIPKEFTPCPFPPRGE